MIHLVILYAQSPNASHPGDPVLARFLCKGFESTIGATVMLKYMVKLQMIHEVFDNNTFILYGVGYLTSHHSGIYCV